MTASSKRLVAPGSDKELTDYYAKEKACKLPVAKCNDRDALSDGVSVVVRLVSETAEPTARGESSIDYQNGTWKNCSESTCSGRS